MADPRLRPIAPVEHADEKEHRRIIANRANAALPKDGTEPMQAPLVLASFTVATLPDATLWAAGLVFVSDGAANQKLRYSDGTNWIVAG